MVSVRSCVESIARRLDRKQCQDVISYLFTSSIHSDSSIAFLLYPKPIFRETVIIKYDRQYRITGIVNRPPKWPAIISKLLSIAGKKFKLHIEVMMPANSTNENSSCYGSWRTLKDENSGLTDTWHGPPNSPVITRKLWVKRYTQIQHKITTFPSNNI